MEIDIPLMLGYIFFILGIILYMNKDTLVSYSISEICLIITMFCYIEADASDILKIASGAIFGSNSVLLVHAFYNKYEKEKDPPSN